jgi:hypothetical protein
VLVTGGLAASAALTIMPRDSHRMVAVFPPWWSAEKELAAAASAGAVGSVGRLPFILAVQSSDSGLGVRLGEAGALLVLDGSAFTFCSSQD